MTLKLLTGSALVVALAACASEPPVPTVTDVAGACADVFGGQVCTWAKLTDAAVSEVGATIPMATLTGAPADAPMAWPPVPMVVLDLPEVVRTETGLTQFIGHWEAGGHPPASFMTPHFDFHFYAMPAGEIDAIDCSDESKPATLPAGYALPDITLPPEMAQMIGTETLVGVCVPKMGMHALPSADVERPDAFEGSMVVGYYAGAPIFIEPMISKAMLMRQQSFDLPVPAVSGQPWKQPTGFHAEYDAAGQAYRFVFSGFESGV